MSDLKLGQIITGPAARDAVHVAVAPVKAGELLIPGTRISLANGIAVQDFEDKAIGIVDPFLQRSVQVGETFWLFLFPGTITALRHEWTHPAFHVQLKEPENSEAREWVTAFAARWKYTFDEFMAGAREYVQKDYNLDDKWEQLDVPDEDWNTFWEHFHALTGLSIADKDKEFVTCCP